MRVFTCYARTDRPAVEPLHEQLVTAGHRGWFDAFILPGENWKNRLREEISACDAFVFVVSPVSVVSDWCRWELATAIELHRPVVPAVLVAGTELPPELRDIQHVDISDGVTPHSMGRLLGGLSLIGLERAREAPSVATQMGGVPVQVAWRNDETTLHISDTAILDEGQDLAPSALSDVVDRWSHRSGRVVGIDFGTVGSLVAVVEDGRPQLVPNATGGYVTPSAVAVSPDGQIVVGENARVLAPVHPERAVLFPKRLLGTGRHLHVDGASYSPATLVSYVLRSLIDDAARHLDEPVTAAVVAAPAYFSQAEIADLRLAVHRAGVVPARMIAEPTAAALTAATSEEDQTIAVYDLGGGTFDISIIEAGDGVYDVKWVAGDMGLGGADYDRALRDHCVAHFLERNGVDLSNDPIALMRIQGAAETAKIALSTAERTTVHVPFVHSDGHHALDLSVPISRAKYEDLTFHLTDATLELCRAAASQAGLRAHEVDELFLVGLTTRTPSLRARVEDLFRRRARRDVDPDRVVALGAAVQAGIIEGTQKDILLLDVVSHGICVTIGRGQHHDIIPASSTVPILRSDVYFSDPPGRRHTLIELIETGAGRGVLAHVVLEVPAHDGKDRPVRITVDIDANKFIGLTAELLGTGVVRACEVDPNARLQSMDSQAEVRLTPAISSMRTLYLDDSPGPRVQRLVRQMSDLGDLIELAFDADNPLAISVTAHDRDREASERRSKRALDIVRSTLAANGIETSLQADAP